MPHQIAKSPLFNVVTFLKLRTMNREFLIKYYLGLICLVLIVALVDNKLDSELISKTNNKQTICKQNSIDD